MFEFAITYAGIPAAAFLVGVFVSQQVKDWFAGVPASLRADLTALEASVKAQVTGAQKEVLANVHATISPPTPPLATSVTMPVAPPVPTP